MISPCLPSAILQNLQFPHLLPFELIKTISWIFPSPGAENPIYPPVFAEIFPWLARGSHENRSKNKLVREKTLTRTHGSYRFGLWASDKITRGAVFFIPRQIFTRVGYFWKSSNSKVWKIFAFEKRNPGRESFALWSGIRDPGSKLHCSTRFLLWQRIRNLVPGIWNRWCGSQNPRPSWVSLSGASKQIIIYARSPMGRIRFKARLR